MPPHEDLLMQTVRFAICLMKGKTDLSRSNARQLYQGNLCQSVANLLKCFKTNTTHVSWMCSSVSLLCQRVADSQQVFGKQTDICKTLSQKELWVLVMPSPTALLTLIKAIRALCYSHEENRRAFCILRVADEAISAVGHCDLGTEGILIVWISRNFRNNIYAMYVCFSSSVRSDPRDGMLGDGSVGRSDQRLFVLHYRGCRPHCGQDAQCGRHYIAEDCAQRAGGHSDANQAPLRGQCWSARLLFLLHTCDIVLIVLIVRQVT